MGSKFERLKRDLKDESKFVRTKFLQLKIVVIVIVNHGNMIPCTGVSEDQMGDP